MAHTLITHYRQCWIYIKKMGENQMKAFNLGKKSIFLATIAFSSFTLLGSIGLTQNSAFAQTKKEVSKPVTVTYWYWLDDPSQNTTQELINKFNATHPGVHVVGRLIPSSNFQQTLINAAASGSLPDTSRFHDWWVGQFATNKLLAPLDSYRQHWAFNKDIAQRYWNTGKTGTNSPIYMIPNEYITFYLYYNKAMFSQAHLTPPKTFQQFQTDAIKLTNPAKHRYGFAMRGGSGGQDQWFAFMLAGGAEMVNNQGNVVINSTKAVSINQWYINLFEKYKVAPPSAVTDSYAQLLADFENGTVAMFAHHIGSYSLLKQALGNKLGVIPLPQSNPKHPATLGSMNGNVIFNSSTNKAADWTWISWLSSPAAINILDRSVNAQLPVLTSVAKEPYFQNQLAWKIAIDEESYATDWPPLPGVGAVSGHVWQQSMDQALLGQVSSKQMVDTIATALQQSN